MDWCVYLLLSDNKKRTYFGASNNPEKRLRAHNGELVGGAKATKLGRPWKHVCIISGLDKISALQLEWRLKKKISKKTNKLVRYSGLKNRIKNIYDVLNLKQWTSNSKPANTIQLKLKWIIPDYKLNDETLPDYIIQE